MCNLPEEVKVKQMTAARGSRRKLVAVDLHSRHTLWGLVVLQTWSEGCSDRQDYHGLDARRPRAAWDYYCDHTEINYIFAKYGGNVSVRWQFELSRFSRKIGSIIIGHGNFLSCGGSWRLLALEYRIVQSCNLNRTIQSERKK
jgi:hypothetical protein